MKAKGEFKMEENHQLSDTEVLAIAFMMIYASQHPEEFPELQIDNS